jgi:putative transposase
VVTTQAKKDAAEVLRTEHGMSQRRACRLLALPKSTFHYKPRPDRNAELRLRLKELSTVKRRWGSPRLHWHLTTRDKVKVSYMRVWRVYTKEGLQLNKRKRPRQAARLRIVMPLPQAPNERWSMDFVHDQLFNGRRFKCFNIVDDFSKECIVIAADTSITGERVTRILDELKFKRGSLPKTIVSDNGPEFTSKAMDQWAYNNNVRIQFIRPGKPNENAFVESFNGKFRDECLNDHWFTGLQEAKVLIEQWRLEYNTERPHSSLGNLTPQEFMEKLKTSST